MQLVEAFTAKKELLRDIVTRQKELFKLNEKLEKLEIRLFAVKRDYENAVGGLYARLDELELDIFRAKKVRMLVRKGYSPEKALDMIDKQLEAERAREEKEQKKEAEHDIPPEPGRELLPEKELKQLRSLWRDMVAEFHPDLTSDGGEKKKREEIIKLVNKAYMEGDIEALKGLSLSHSDQVLKEAGMEELKVKLSGVRRSIRRVQEQIKLIRRSVWFMWLGKLEKARRQKLDLFAGLKQKLLAQTEKMERLLLNLQRPYAKKKIPPKNRFD